MSDQAGGEPSVRDLTPEEVARGLAEGRMVLVDVREPNETALERFPAPSWCRCRLSIQPTFRSPMGARSCLPAAPAAVR